jgi:hypothetical protein
VRRRDRLTRSWQAQASYRGWAKASLYALVEAGNPEAIDVFELIGDSDPAERGAAYWALGEALAHQADVGGANEPLRLAVELLRGQRIWHEAAAACRTWGTVLRDAGRESEAATTLEQATALESRAAASMRPTR